MIKKRDLCRPPKKPLGLVYALKPIDKGLNLFYSPRAIQDKDFNQEELERIGGVSLSHEQVLSNEVIQEVYECINEDIKSSTRARDLFWPYRYVYLEFSENRYVLIQ